MVKNLPAIQETQVQLLCWEDPLEKENGNPLQCSCLANSMDREAWRATVHGAEESWTRLSGFLSCNVTLTDFEPVLLFHLKDAESNPQEGEELTCSAEQGWWSQAQAVLLGTPMFPQNASPSLWPQELIHFLDPVH